MRPCLRYTCIERAHYAQFLYTHVGPEKGVLAVAHHYPRLIYLDGKRISQDYEARLRTDSSSLNHHLHSKNITDSPFYICGIEHYLFECNSSMNCARKRCKNYLHYVNQQHCIHFNMATQSFLMRAINTFFSVLK